MMTFVSLMLHAQGNYEIKEGMLSMSRGEKNSFTLVIPDATASLAEDTWKKYMRDFKGRPKLDKKSNEWVTDDAELKAVSENTIDIYTKFHENLGAHFTEATFWFDLGGAYMSSEVHPDKYAFSKQFMNKYGDLVTSLIIEEELKAQEKRLKELEGDLSKLVKENDDFHKKIQEAQSIIDEMEKNIKVNVNAQDVKKSEIEGHRGLIDEVNTKLNRYKV
jgi:hypothetical protein